MINSPHRLLSVHSTSKIGHDPYKEPPKGAILVDVLKTLEVQFQRRGMLPSGTESGPGIAFHPLWFVAETERNVFLWRQGCSLIQQDEFEFWVDLEALISKRLNQLDSATPENPFLNPLWGGEVQDAESASKEREYLSAFMAVAKQIEAHVHALSMVGRELRKEAIDKMDRQVVVLPGSQKPRTAGAQ